MKANMSIQNQRKKKRSQRMMLSNRERKHQRKKKAVDKVQHEGYFCQLIYMSFPFPLVGPDRKHMAPWQNFPLPLPTKHQLKLLYFQFSLLNFLSSLKSFQTNTLRVGSCFFLGVEWLVRKGMRLDALKEGGLEFKFFHLSSIVRRHWNYNADIKLHCGQWIQNRKEIEKYFAD